jgi:hypothetical protein
MVPNDGSEKQQSEKQHTPTRERVHLTADSQRAGDSRDKHTDAQPGNAIAQVLQRNEPTFQSFDLLLDGALTRDA